ncbi:hypothetical protein HDV57DRAFT_303145 [Trichoderma longibrachiatum]
MVGEQKQTRGIKQYRLQGQKWRRRAKSRWRRETRAVRAGTCWTGTGTCAGGAAPCLAHCSESSANRQAAKPGYAGALLALSKAQGASSKYRVPTNTETEVLQVTCKYTKSIILLRGTRARLFHHRQIVKDDKRFQVAKLTSQLTGTKKLQSWITKRAEATKPNLEEYQNGRAQTELEHVALTSRWTL